MYNYLLKYFGNGTLQLTYYHNSIRLKEDNYSPSATQGERVATLKDEMNLIRERNIIDELDDSFCFEAVVDYENMVPGLTHDGEYVNVPDIKYKRMLVTPFGYGAPEDGYASTLPKKEYTPEELLARKQRSLYVSLTRSKKMIIDYGRANIWHWFFTLTFEPVDGFNAENYVEASQKVRDWFKNIRKRYCPKLKYLAVPEMHVSGAWHFHCLAANCDELNFKIAVNNRRFVKDKVTGEILLDAKGQPVPNKYFGDKLRTSYPDGDFIYNIENYKSGFSTATRVKDTKKAVSYIIKYITKELCEVTFHKRRYLPSNNLDLPVKSYGFSDPKDLMELITDIEYTYGMKLSIEHIKTYDVAVENYSNTVSVMEFAMPNKDEIPGQIPDLYKILERIYG